MVGTAVACDTEMNGSSDFYLYFGQAALCSGAAAVVVIGLLSQADIDRLIIGFLAGLTFSYIMAFFHHQAKERFGCGFISFPKGRINSRPRDQ